jgi:hypothetical protein
MLLSAVILNFMTGCTANTTTSDRLNNQTSQVDQIIQQQIKNTEPDITDQITATSIPVTDVPEQITDMPNNSENLQKEQISEITLDYTKVDIDLTELSSTMVYSEVYNMMSMPENYIGKTVRMEGDFYTYYDENQNQYYFACLIRDATACCAQGIEFVLAGDYTYPDDYPEEGSSVCVSGVFDTYEDGPYTYCTLRNAKFE